MKVLQVINSLHVGGAETLLVNHAISLKKRNVQVDVLTLLDADTFLTDKLQSQGIKVKSLQASNIYSPINVFRLRKYLKDYDIIHIHLFPTLYWVVFSCILFRIRAKLVYTEHSTTNRRRENGVLQYIDRYIYSKLDVIVSISLKSKENLEKHLQKQDCVYVIENGVNVQSITDAKPLKRSSLGISKKAFVITMVARFCYPKDQLTLIKAMSLLSSNFVLVLVGEGPNRNECESYVKKLNLGSQVFFLGIRSDVPSILKMSDVVVLSSLYEGLSLSSIEGMSACKPFIATNAPGLSEIIQNKEMLFEVGDYKKLANLIIQVTKNKKDYDEYSLESYQNALKYDINKMTGEYIYIYNKILKNVK